MYLQRFEFIEFFLFLSFFFYAKTKITESLLYAVSLISILDAIILFCSVHRPRSSLTIEKIDAMSLIYSRRFVSINIESFLFSIRRRFIVFFLYLINIFERSILSMLKCWKRKLLKQITFTRYEKANNFEQKVTFFFLNIKIRLMKSGYVS